MGFKEGVLWGMAPMGLFGILGLCAAAKYRWDGRHLRAARRDYQRRHAALASELMRLGFNPDYAEDEAKRRLAEEAQRMDRMLEGVEL